ncbi:nitroreductase family deazaflavin-dependent oxidoreductase [Tomitella fengzijianii]|uniref:Nitroreductase family deazaflavin-dependent oxidoreductase n=1 Tax=Tomitella fengzijianii TaxID=2597660 RepID=A0A516X651_9ACTN|nr:nitroreductase family deazaflavin-dependent oxidoreductase [Tomitella fengzijianii]QDQ98536.1 nitroreductase family deazaflavin-dependent oxidoreductase [Tomitella fengzijianii]
MDDGSRDGGTGTSESTGNNEPVARRTPPATPVIAPRWLPRVNRRFTNRVQGVWAPHVPPWAVILHVGRNSGRAYETPVLALLRKGTVSVALPYGARSDWVRNIFAAQGCRLRRRGRILELTDPRIVTDGSGGNALPRPMRALAGRVGILVMDEAAPPN